MPDEKDFYKEIIDNLYDGVYFVDRDRVITYWNKGAERITGYSSKQAVGRACRDNLLNHVTANGVQLCQSNCPLAAAMEDGNDREAEVFVHHADGHRVPIIVRASVMRDKDGNVIGAVESFSNNNSVIEARNKIRELRRTAMTDPLTGIGSRKHIEGRLNAAIAEYQHNASVMGLLFMDIDRFKQVNDTYGHNVGDEALRMVSRTIRYALRATDTVGRWGGEEIVAILYDLQSVESLYTSAEKVRILVERSELRVNGTNLIVTLSMGGTLLHAGDTPEAFIERADKLMYRSKQAGRNRVTVE